MRNPIKGAWLAVLFTLVTLPASAEPVMFVAIGDQPYIDTRSKTPDWQFERFAAVVSPAVHESGAAFVAHYGDFKAGVAPCDLAGIRRARAEMNALLDGPVFYTPGDNDWTDCDRKSTGAPVSELAQLALLRGEFFSMPSSKALEQVRQPNYPENARWQVGKVVFATLHIVGTNNGRRQIRKDDVELALALVTARDHANRVWLAQTLKHARRAKAEALVIITQADLTSSGGAGVCTSDNRMNCDGHAAIRGHLTNAALRFNKPMLLVHGGTYPYCLDKGFGGPRTPNLWRLNAAGDFKIVDATKITVDVSNANMPFAITTLVDGIAPDEGCR